jgi:hypothetical protein
VSYIPLSDDQYRAIGRITVLSAQLEFAANILAWRLIKPPSHSAEHSFIDQGETIEIGRRAFGGDSFASIVVRIQRLSEYVLRRSPQTLAEVQRWTAEARDLQERRNEIIHAFWTHVPTGEAAPYRFLGKGEPKAVRTPVGELDQFADEIDAAVKEVAPTLRAIGFPTYLP